MLLNGCRVAGQYIVVMQLQSLQLFHDTATAVAVAAAN